MDRRELLLGGAGLAAAVSLGGAVRAHAGSGSFRTLRDLARRAWLYGLPLVEVAAVRKRALDLAPANTVLHQRELTTPANQRVTAPNNDTLYSRAILDLSRGPVELTLPPIGDRYQSVALMDMVTNHFAVLGTRTTGTDGGRFVIAGPTGPAPAGAIRAPGPWAFLLVRTLIAGPSDLAEAHRVQDGVRLAGPTGPAPSAVGPVPRLAPWRDYFRNVGELLAENPPPATDLAFFQQVSPLGLRPDRFAPPSFTAAEEAEITAGVAEAIAIAQDPEGGTYVANGWRYPRANLGDFGEDYEFRGQIALTGLFALPTAEAVYARSIGERGTGFFHGDCYRLSFGPGQTPLVNSFWSLTVYEARPEGQLMLAANPIDRYSIGDRTPGLRYRADGGLDLWICRRDPGRDRSANWLPAPAGAFLLTMRAYLPKPAVVTGEYRFPAPAVAD